MIVVQFTLAGKAKDVFRDLSLMVRLEKATGMVLLQYRPLLPANSNN